MALFTKYRSGPWYAPALEYLRIRNVSIEDRLIETFRFVDVDENNGRTFSYEYASILRDAGSTFASVMEAFVRGVTDKTGKTYFNDYKNLLIKEDSEISSRSLLIIPHRKNGVIIPLHSLENNTATPAWWSAFTEVKHSEYTNYKQGSLGNAITAVAALKVLGIFAGVVSADGPLWANVGTVYPTNPSYNNRPFLEFE
jgi:hypothetical protein